MEPRDVFISHVEEDSATARALARELRTQRRSTWMYEENGVAGISYLTQVYGAITSCRAFVLLASPQSVNAHQVISEIEQAHESQKVIVAVRLRMTHEEFITSNPILRMACGTAVTLSADEGGLTEIAHRIATSLRYAEPEPQGTHPRDALMTEPPADGAVPSDSSPPHERTTGAKKRLFRPTAPRMLIAAASVTTGLAALYLILHFRPAPPPGPAPTPSPAHALGKADVEQVIARLGPHFYVHPQDPCLMDDPEYVLDHGATLNWGVVGWKESTEPCQFDLSSFHSFVGGSIRTSTKTLLRDVSDSKAEVGSGKYKHWLDIDYERVKPADLKRARALVRVLPVDPNTTEFQFWLFYPCNRPALAEVCGAGTPSQCRDRWLNQYGRRYGRWEHVSLLVSNQNRQLLSVYMSGHAGRDGLPKAPSELTFYGEHPVIYAAMPSHAQYASPGSEKKYRRIYARDWGPGTASIDLFDRTAEGSSKVFESDTSFRIISSDLSSFQMTEPDWLEFDGPWGQYEKLADTVHWRHPLHSRAFRCDAREVGHGSNGPKYTRSWSGDFVRQ
jgi:hypothetical protein